MFTKKIRQIYLNSYRSQFAVIGDELIQQLKEILEGEAEEGESKVFKMAR